MELDNYSESVKKAIEQAAERLMKAGLTPIKEKEKVVEAITNFFKQSNIR